MGWGDCGTDSKGRPIGYVFEATCDHPGCDAKINRGLSHACGGMHGELGGQACEGYFCSKHLVMVDHKAMGYTELSSGQLCEECLKQAREEIADLVIAGDMRLTEVES